MRYTLGKGNYLYIHLTLVPYIKAADELKTKPTQHSVKELQSIGIQPNILLCRSDRPLPRDMKRKIALFCNVEENAVITAQDVDTIYEVPLHLHEEGLDDRIVEMLDLKAQRGDLSVWETIVKRVKQPLKNVTIALVGKYVDLKESYKSLCEALTHGGIANDAKVSLCWVDSEEIEAKGADVMLKGMDGILVPGGFGIRGVEGKIAAVKYARENKIPYFGICLGMQCAVIEAARNLAGLAGANSSEFDSQTPHPVIYLIEQWYDHRTGTVQKRDLTSDKGGSMRLGAYPCKLEKASLAFEAYAKELISERHRHRYEFNNKYLDRLKKAGLVISGLSPDGELVEIVELKDHPWFLGCQFQLLIYQFSSCGVHGYLQLDRVGLGSKSSFVSIPLGHTPGKTLTHILSLTLSGVLVILLLVNIVRDILFSVQIDRAGFRSQSRFIVGHTPCKIMINRLYLALSVAFVI